MPQVIPLVVAVGLKIAGASVLVSTIAITAASIGVSLLTKSSAAPATNNTSRETIERLNASIDPRAGRKSVIGTTAMATDIRDQEYSADQAYLHRFIVCASHKVHAIRELWFDDQLVWTLAGGVQGKYAGYLEVTPVLEGNAGNAIYTSDRIGYARRFTGCAYLYLKYKLTGNGGGNSNDSPFAQSIPSRMTIIGDGAYLYDPRRDSTVAGGSGPQRIDDQSTWEWDEGRCRNPALALLWYLIGYKINGKLAVGCGIPPSRLLLQKFITAANFCDEPVALAVGGTEPRYRCDGVWSENDDRRTVVEMLKATMNAEFDDFGGGMAPTIIHNDIATPVAYFTTHDVISAGQWDGTTELNQKFNVVRGTYTDASNNSLYQQPDYPQVELAAVDGIERADTFNLPMVESPSQCQRLAKMRLQRHQYGGTIDMVLQITGWRVQKNDPIRLTYAPLGWVNKAFRVSEIDNRTNGKVPVKLREENTDLYQWDNDETAAVVAAAPTVYNQGLNPIINAIDTSRDPDLISDAMNYLDVSVFLATWPGGGAGEISVVPSTDIGGTCIQIGNNAGDDGQARSHVRAMPYDPEDLYSIEFDVDFGASSAGASAYFGVAAENAAGVNLPADGGTYNYFAAAGFLQNATGHRTFTGYFRGRAAVGAGNSVGLVSQDRSNPLPVPNGTVRVRPVMIVNYPGQPGTVKINRMRLAKIVNANVIFTGAWSNVRSYFKDEGVYYLGRSFASKNDGNLNHVPPATATSDANWYLVADRGADGLNAITIYLTSTRDNITYNGAGVMTPAGQSVTFTAQRQNTADPATFTIEHGHSVGAHLPGAGDVRTMSAASVDAILAYNIANFGDPTLAVTVTLPTGQTDTVRITRTVDGSNGTAGADAKTVVTSADREQVIFDGANNPNPAAQDISFSAQLQNIATAIAWTLKDNLGNVLTPGTYLSATAGSPVTMTTANFIAALAVNGATGVVATATADGISHSVSVAKVKDGSSPGGGAIDYVYGSTYQVTLAAGATATFEARGRYGPTTAANTFIIEVQYALHNSGSWSAMTNGTSAGDSYGPPDPTQQTVPGAYFSNGAAYAQTYDVRVVESGGSGTFQDNRSYFRRLS